MDYPRNAAVPPFINSYMRWCGANDVKMLGGLGVIPAGMAWDTANQAIFIPLFIPWTYTVERAFWVNGSAAGGNSDIGIFTPGGANLWSAGSTVGTGSSTVQYVTLSTPLLLSPGAYLLGFNHSDTTANRLVGGTVTAITGRLPGALMQASAFPLPSPASFAAFAKTAWPLIGITNTASGF
jgi:hypothetical protein